MLKDGRWHTMKELQQKTKLNRKQVQQTVAFLKEYSFIMIDEMEKKIRLEEIVREFITQTAI